MGGVRLPFLLKILAAESPLSIQAHPTLEQARHGFARENEAGIPLDSSIRNYRDDQHKPEIIVALTEFSALCGFRPSASRNRIVQHLESVGVAQASALRERCRDVASALAWLLNREEGVDELVRDVSTISLDNVTDDEVADALAVARRLASYYPGDPGIVVSLLLNHRILQPGEALYLPAGNIHAYLHGVGIEVMAASDNVLRGGLTSKHVDVPELLSVLDFREIAIPTLVPRTEGAIRRFDPGLAEFQLLDCRVDGKLSVDIHGPAIALIVDGAVRCEPGIDGDLTAGRSVFIEAGEVVSHLIGSGHVFIAVVPST